MILTALLTTQMTWMLEARARQVDAQPTLALFGPRLELSRPRLGARRELMVGLWLSAASVSSIVLGGSLMGAGDRYGSFSAGLSLSIMGAAVVYPTALTLLYGAGHNSALRELDGASLDTIDRVEARALRIERTGGGLFGGGMGLMLVGVGLIIGGLQGANFDHGGGGNVDMFWSGFALALVGDVTWFAGTLVWTYGGGVHRGVHQARASMHASLGGLAGTF